MILRPETTADHAAVAQLLVDAFGGSEEARLVELIRASDEYVAELALVAEVDGAVVGHILLSRVTVESRADRVVSPALALAPVAVAPAHQRTGIGTALVRAGLERAMSRTEAVVVVLGHPAYYPRFGFRPASSYRIAAPWPDIPDDAFLVYPLPAYTVVCHGVVAYPPAFDAV